MIEFNDRWNVGCYSTALKRWDQSDINNLSLCLLILRHGRATEQGHVAMSYVLYRFIQTTPCYCGSRAWIELIGKNRENVEASTCEMVVKV